MSGKWLHSKAASYFNSVFSITPCSLPFMTFREGRMCVRRKLVMILLLSLLELTIQVSHGYIQAWNLPKVWAEPLVYMYGIPVMPQEGIK